MKIELDYNIITAEDRCTAVNGMQLELKNVTTRELERVANYILYGKTAKGNALPEAKEISTKHGTWKKKEPESLDALMENVLFDETTLRPLSSRSPYTNPKPTIDKVKDAGIPGMADLWAAIGDIEARYEEEKLNGKTLRAYYLRHLLIDLRKEQYSLKAIFRPTIHFVSATHDTLPHEVDWTADSGYCSSPLATNSSNTEYIGDPNWEWHVVAKHTVDLSDPNHIYHILDNYSALRHQIYDFPTSGTAFLLHAVECLISKTKLTPARYHILIRKVDHAPNDVIAKELVTKFGMDYAVNYISTIWTKEICGAIAKTGKQDYDEWLARNLPHKWKRCIRCHTDKLRDGRFFAPRRTAFDGFTPICRECQKEGKK